MSDYWGIWAGNVAEIAQNHITRLQTILSDETNEAYHAFESFHKELKNTLNRIRFFILPIRNYIAI